MNNPRGFAAVSSVLVLGLALVLVTASTALSAGAYLHADTRVEDSFVAQRLAEGCMETALMRVRTSTTYAGNETVTIGSKTCTIKPLIGGTSTTIQTEATVNGSPYRLQVVLDNLSTVHVSSYSHVASF